MFISSLSLTALVLACVSFFAVRASTTTATPTNGTASSSSTTHPHPSAAKKHPHPSAASGLKIRNFIATDALYDGEQEKRIHYNGVTAKETSVSAGPTDGNMRESIKLRQATDGMHFIQLIYGADDTIKDCEFIRQKKIVYDFLETFRDDVERARMTSTLDDDRTVRVARVGDDGRTHYEDVSAALYEDAEDETTGFRNVTFRVLEGGSPLPSEVAAWLDYESLKSQCKKSHQELKKLVRRQRHGTEEEKKDASDHIERSKRELTDVLIVPGTKWCGPHQLASRYVELGPLSSIDRCCRKHDHCRIAIPGFTNKYHFFNYRPFTLSHCGCDSSFRTCLKMSGTGAANLVGKLFFNIVQTKCFVLKPEKTCVRRSWWGKCEKQVYKKQAHLRDNIPY